jgi:DNA-binding transcriptional ArsR family regulator
MRYTTVIDVTEIPSVARNPHAFQLYCYLAMKSGYHDDDRDLIDVGYRRLAYLLGQSPASIWHALRVLAKAGLVTREKDGRLRIKKWLSDQPISPRKKTKKQQSDETAALERALAMEKRAREYEERSRNAITYKEYLRLSQEEERSQQSAQGEITPEELEEIRQHLSR